MSEPMDNAREIRGVLDGGVLQFKSGRKWIDAGGDANTWLVLLVSSVGRDGTYRIKPGTLGVQGCPNAASMGEHACANRSQCWEPCGELGRSDEHVRCGRDDPAKAADGVTTPDRVATPGCKCLGEGKANFNVHATNCQYRTHGVIASDGSRPE